MMRVIVFLGLRMEFMQGIGRMEARIIENVKVEFGAVFL